MNKQDFINERLKKYAQYWNEEKQIYEIDDEWSPTREELIDDLKKSYEFEYGSGPFEHGPEPEEVKILQVSSVIENGLSEATIYGLGTDNKVYWWDNKKGVWQLNALEPTK